MSGKQSETDRQIVESVRCGERDAESLFVNRYHGPVLARVSAKVGDPPAAADITQEVIVGVLCALRDGRLRCEDRLAQYVSATTTNVVRRHLTGRTAFVEIDLNLVPSAAAPPDELVDRRQQLGAVARALEGLSERDRGILALSLVDGLTSREVAQHTGMTPAQVRQRKARALRKLRDHVSSQLGE